ncbi:hypothetical protein RUMHYD_01701 [Blautia hydrogenotrophica DSM 10507]|uniref:Uncharacterized protein n=1 Tax=Blautia hydrogenotrophica (strain DSM 10507 / JCM 14656 / S5a33) TaxID=476272 RepID=C0CLH9_BLAHS|nr:hypothetical protein RUMHYD_01701 [Blautia hydrogenotrophica DSM 10507]
MLQKVTGCVEKKIGNPTKKSENRLTNPQILNIIFLYVSEMLQKL